MSKISASILGIFFVICALILSFGLSRVFLEIKSMERSVVVKGLSEREVSADVMFSYQFHAR